MLQDGASTWLGLSLQDWAAVFGIILGIAGVGALLGQSFRWVRRRIDAWPVSAEFGFTGDSIVDADGVRWEMAWLQNTGSRAYVHDVSSGEVAYDFYPEKRPKVASVDEIGSLPQELRSLSEQELRHKEGVFRPQYLRGKKRILFYVSCPPGIVEFTLVATMGIGRWGRKQSVTSEWLNVPNPESPAGPEGPAGVKSVLFLMREGRASRRERLAAPAEGAED